VAASFTLAIYPWVYKAQYQEDGSWSEHFDEKEHRSAVEEAAMPEDERRELLGKRNSFPELPLVNYTTQYGMGCFEGLKAFPQPDGSLKIFRPDQNAKRMHTSMEGLMMPAYPTDMFVEAVRGLVRRNYDMGFFPEFDEAWEEDGFVTARAVYIRPFSYAEPGIGLNLSSKPWVVMVTTPVGSYFDPDADAKAITTDKARATKGGTGWIKCDANYVIPTLTKKKMQKEGYMEVIFLDAATQSYVEEGSSSNIFFVMDHNTLVTPSLEDTILPGITRISAMQLAKDEGVTVEERRVTIDEVMDRATECFVTGTAAGVSYIESVEHRGKTKLFHDGTMGELTRELQWKLRGTQYGVIEDTHGWMFSI